MSSALIDTCVLFDILNEDPRWSPWSEQALTEAVDAGRAFINSIIYAELSTYFLRREQLDDVLQSAQIEIASLPLDAAFLAGRAFLAYRRRGGMRSSPLPDFFIGAHALVAGAALVTRDTARFRSYFPALHLVTPPGK